MAEISDERHEELRLILEKKNRLRYSLKEPIKIGGELIDFYILLYKFNNKDEEHESN